MRIELCMLLGAVLIVESGSSRKERPAIPGSYVRGRDRNLPCFFAANHKTLKTVRYSWVIFEGSEMTICWVFSPLACLCQG